MSDISPIEWTDATWNPIAGCSLKSPGCARCYAMPMARRHELMMAALGRVSPYAGLTRVVNDKAVWAGDMRLVEAALTLPLRWRRPRRIFVNSMSDLFHEDVPDAWIDRVFAVMALCPQHTFQVLTKRSARMRAYLSSRSARDEHGYEAEDIRVSMTALAGTPSRRKLCPALKAIPLGQYCRQVAWPLPNVWLGVSAEDQRRADERVPDLLATPAAVRFVSAEPLLGPIDLRQFMWPVHGWWKGPHNSYAEAKAAGAECGLKRQALVGAWCTFLDWVIVGGESGPGARPMHPDWARQIRDACAAAGVAFHFKQHGAWLALSQGAVDERDRKMLHQGTPDSRDVLYRVGKGAAGRLLDGVEHNGFPEARS